MSGKLDRRSFLGKSVAASAGAALAFNFEEKVLLAQKTTSGVKTPKADVNPKAFSVGKIGDLTLTRLICGGNLTSGFAHSRDLIYVSALLRQYFTDEKIYETWQLCEQQGLNAMILRIDEQVIRLVKTYRAEYGGKFHWLAQCKMTEDDVAVDIRRAIDNGAAAAYIHGGVADKLVSKNRLDLIAKALEIIKKNGLPAGVGGHSIHVPIACEEAGLDVDFYMKTINSKNYWSAGPMPRNDSVWAETPEITVEFMSKVKKPWIGYKILGAGAIPPREGIKYAFESGCDFICVGMFDFQVEEDVKIARDTLAAKLDRKRPWC
ncbi:MAG: hypothetical protein J7M40_12365 [Planctomycetes bacterium]|nr:hypothetical protein [Planctomycetota bacterium]